MRIRAICAMIPRMDTMTIGPEHGDLTLHTGVEGRAAKAGHNLTIRLADWSGTATFDGDEPSSLSFRTALSSLEVVSGEGGVKALSDKDKRTIKDSALESLSAKRHPEVTFESSKVSPAPAATTSTASCPSRASRSPARWTSTCSAAVGTPPSRPPSPWCRPSSASSPTRR